jgi:hypothetical protein
VVILSAILFLGAVFFLIGMRVFLRNQPIPKDNARLRQLIAYENLGYLFAVFLAVSAAIIFIYSGGRLPWQN